MTKILIVDDNEMDRVLAAHLLSNHYEVIHASDGEEGLALCESECPDVVVTDLVMPRLDGMQLLDELQVRHPDIPVIMITSEGSEATAAEALDRGASSYVPKMHVPERLSETVDQVVDLMRADRDYARLLQRMTYCRYTFVLENDFTLIEPLVEFLQQIAFSEGFCNEGSRSRLGIALHEALFNAMYHGNLELPEEANQLVRNLVREGRPIPIVNERREDANFENRRVLVDIKTTMDDMKIVIQDEGDGFDHSRFGGSNGSSRDSDSHRGIVLIKSIMDQVAYNDEGNKLTLVKRRGHD